MTKASALRQPTKAANTGANQSTFSDLKPVLLSTSYRAEKLVAHIVVFLAAIRYRLPLGTPIGVLVGLALLPVAAPYLLRHRGGLTIAGLAIASAVSGLLLTLSFAAEDSADGRLASIQTIRVLGLPLVLMALLWARNYIGTRRMLLTFGFGGLASLIVSGLDMENLWKVSLSIPVTLIVLSLSPLATRRGLQTVAALSLVAVSALNDSRSAAGLLLIAAAVTLLQSGSQPASARKPWQSWGALARIALIGIGAFLTIQAAALEGVLGEGARSRTAAQISQSGSVLVGGRPEMGAAFALIADRPLGYGPGALATYERIMIGKAGMKSLGYDPNNGYVEKYMFGSGIEVHSVLGDLWILFGLAGAALALAVLMFTLLGLGDALSRGTATAAATYLILRVTWDFAFSPFGSTMIYLPLTLAVALPTLHNSLSHRQAEHRSSPPGPPARALPTPLDGEVAQSADPQGF